MKAQSPDSILAGGKIPLKLDYFLNLKANKERALPFPLGPGSQKNSVFQSTNEVNNPLMMALIS